MRACIEAEKAGVPAVAVTSAGFTAMASVICQRLGHPFIPIAEFPGVPMTEGEDSFRSKVTGPLLNSIIDGLTRTISTDNMVETREPDAEEIVATGYLDVIEEEFVQRGWSDGLPIIPPTLARVKDFLRFTERDPGEVIGVLLPGARLATVWTVAVNGVMAGCRPEYMPILLSVVECLADPQFRLQDAGSTPGWEPLVIVSGPLANDLNFNSGSGVMRVGRQANTSIGRFTRLYMRNVAGLRIPPDQTDKGSFGMSFNVALAEDERAIEDIDWPPFRADRGYPGLDTVITVQSVVAISQPIYSGGATAREHLHTLGWLFSSTMGPWSVLGLYYKAWHPLLAISPSVASVLAGAGYRKDDVRAYLQANSFMSAGQLERYAWEVGVTGVDLTRLVRDGALPSKYHESDDPNRLVPLILEAGDIGIVVAGDPGRNQSKVYVNNHVQGKPVSRPVRLPSNWTKLSKS